MSPHHSSTQPCFDPELGAPAWRDFGGLPASTWAHVHECFVMLRGTPRDLWHGAIDRAFHHDRQAGYEVLTLLIADDATTSAAPDRTS